MMNSQNFFCVFYKKTQGICKESHVSTDRYKNQYSHHFLLTQRSREQNHYVKRTNFLKQPALESDTHYKAYILPSVSRHSTKI